MRNARVNTLFPKDNYTPFGYIDNPYHSVVHKNSGVIRTVPPLGLGFWCRDLPFPYGKNGFLRNINYLSFVHPSLQIGDIILHKDHDFQKNNIDIKSYYHTKNVLSYDFTVSGVEVSFKYFLQEEDVLTCVVSFNNTTHSDSNVVLHLTNIYGYPQSRWWGCDGFLGYFNKRYEAAVSKIWAYGDVFALRANRPHLYMKATKDCDQWDNWIYTGDNSSNQGDSTEQAMPIYTMIGYEINVCANSSEELVFSMVRDVNEQAAVDKLYQSLPRAYKTLQDRYIDDNSFYSQAPLLVGDFDEVWKRGMVYHFETIRMTMRPPIGLHTHYWDSMQIHSPRMVLGETAIDCMCLSYGDVELAKDIIYGTFADAISPQVPCSREDGSVNMISKDGSECATAPIWVLLFPTIRFIHARTGDDIWISKLYDYLERYLKWWEDNRTDNEGYFHVQCSWEAQDGSKRFALDYEDGEIDVAGTTTGTRTVDLQAAMADGYRCMAYFSKVLNKTKDTEKWLNLTNKHINMTNAMFYDGEFRDYNCAANKPIIQEDYRDVMMTVPFAVKAANDENIHKGKWIFEYFKDNPTHWLEWPSFLYIFTEGAWNCGERTFISNVVADVANREYPKLDMRTKRDVMIDAPDTSFPEEYYYRVPGVANEFWAIKEDNPGGCENYGWGATLPTLIIRNILGFREITDTRDERIILAPTIPDDLMQSGKCYGVKNLQYRNHTISYNCTVCDNELVIEVTILLNRLGDVTVYDTKSGKELTTSHSNKEHCLKLKGENSTVYEIVVEA